MTTFFHHRSAERRGVMLLLALGMLTLFVMMGAVLVVLATRARTASRAFAEAVGTMDSGGTQSSAVLDEALMLLLRGSKAPPASMSESILGDKYGAPTTATVTGLAFYSNTVLRPGSLLTASLSNLAPAITHPCELNGRILTLRPSPGDGDVASYRILRATGNGSTFTVYLANLPTNRATVLPRTTCQAVVNGREFLDEPYDAFAIDPWLARVELTDSRVTRVWPSFAADLPAVVDNDGDGVADGAWVSGVLPGRRSPRGGTLRYDVSYHVLDLDGRINLNAHGTLTPTMAAADWTPAPAVPVGLGYGPADIDASRLLAAGPNATAVPGYPSALWSNVLVAGTGTTTILPTADQRLPRPRLGAAVEGRYGVGGRPGRTGATTSAQEYWSLVGAASKDGASPTDLQGRVKMSITPATSGVPTLNFYTPDRSTNDLVESPYALRLDADSALGAVVRQPAAQATTPPADNPFTVSELERVLRQFDTDTAILPQRLAMLLEGRAQRLRMSVTTDSWDTPAMAGTAMRRVQDYMLRLPAPTSPAPSVGAGAAVYGVFSPDVTAGLRFDINRPIDVDATLTASLKQKYCQHLFALLVALGRPADAETAQWAANVCDFRDPDSTMTMFRYDTNLLDGWSVDTSSPIVFGAERPEVVITESRSWTGRLFVALHHPWNTAAADRASALPGTVKPPESIDPNLAAGNLSTNGWNNLQLAKKNLAGDSIWQLRVNDIPVVAFGDTSSPDTSLAPGGYLCVQTAEESGVSPTDMPKLTVATLAPGAAGPGKVSLWRLANPTAANQQDVAQSSYNPYVKVDEATLDVAVDKATSTVQMRNKSGGAAAFWKQVFSGDGDRVLRKHSRPAAWFHWPNRPFVGIAEVALVPTGDASGMLVNYAMPTATQSPASPMTDPSGWLLDAVYVPSRFAGTAVEIGQQPDGSNLLLVAAANLEGVCTTRLPRWREPGRVNVNTIASNIGNSTLSFLDDGVWKAVSGDAAPAANPFATGRGQSAAAGDAADSFTELLALDRTPDRRPFAESTSGTRGDNAFFTAATAIRLSNAATIRSHVFAVWITVRTTDDSADPLPTTTRRMFAIVDRSVPVGYSPGENLNAREAIRLQRFLE